MLQYSFLKGLEKKARMKGKVIPVLLEVPATTVDHLSKETCAMVEETNTTACKITDKTND